MNVRNSLCFFSAKILRWNDYYDVLAQSHRASLCLRRRRGRREGALILAGILASGVCVAEPAGTATLAANRAVGKGETQIFGLGLPANPSAQDLFRAHVFEEPLVPIGEEPTPAENTALTAALNDYSKRTSPDDFSSLTDFINTHPNSPWRAALLTDLGLEYYNSAHYSLALEAFTQAWGLAKDATDLRAKALADRAVGELSWMYARLGRMSDLEPLLDSLQNRALIGPGSEKITGAREGLSNMKNRPEIAFRCGPLALHRIKLATDPKNAGPATLKIYKSASTRQGFSLTRVAQLSKEVGLNYQMAFREKGSGFVVPSVIHWKVGHYAAIIREENGRYLLQDPTFRTDVWATRTALEEEASGYFLIPSGPLPAGWRAVTVEEGDSVWGKGNVGGPDTGAGGGGNSTGDGGGDGDDPDNGDPDDPGDPGDTGDNGSGDEGGGESPGDTGGDGFLQDVRTCQGMPVSSIEMLFISLTLSDRPVGYRPPVGPSVHFLARYNQRDLSQPANFNYSSMGPKWTFQWLSYVVDNPLSPSADVQYYRMGGFSRVFTGFSPASQTFALQQYDLTRLRRTSPNSYEMVSRNGSKRIFSQPDGSIGTSRKVFLTQIIDPAGNALSLTYDATLRVTAITDAIGQVTTFRYENTNDFFQITRVTDPFGRFATFEYDPYGRLSKITDAIGLASRFTYDPGSDFINALITPYGTTSFIRTEGGGRALERHFPDGGRDRAEFNQSTSLGIGASVPASTIPAGMATHNDYLYYRNTYYWSRVACAQAYGDYTKARIYHWLHTADIASASGVLESTKEALEGRVWRDYPGQPDPVIIGTSSRPTHIGRVLDDGTTQLYSYQYNSFGKLSQWIDPVGRTFSYLYDTNDIDVLEVRQTRAGNNDLLFQATYNAQHRRLTSKTAAGQVTTRTYNARGQLLTLTNPKGEITTYTYDSNGYLKNIDGPLPGPGDASSFTYDAVGRTRTYTDSDGYTVTLDYDNLDRLTRVTHPDGTSETITYNLLDVASFQDRAGRTTTFVHNNIRQLMQQTDPLNRSTFYQWCKCGAAKSITDAMGRTTAWQHDVQGRVSEKDFPDGSKITFLYENSTSRLRQKVDEKMQVTAYLYNRDDTLNLRSYFNCAVATPNVSFTYDANYRRVLSMTDGIGTTLYTYNPVTVPPMLGANELASVTGPLPNETIAFGYDQLNRRVTHSINGVASQATFDSAGRMTNRTDALGAFNYTYDGSSRRPASVSGPNGFAVTVGYFNNQNDRLLQQIRNSSGANLISQFNYGYDVAASRITNWTQQTGTATPLIMALDYDPVNQLISAIGISNGTIVKTFGYSYDPAANRLSERIDSITNVASYNVLNQLTSLRGNGSPSATFEWDGAQRLAAVNSGSARTEFLYDGKGRRVGIRDLVSGVEISNRRFVWEGSEIREERTPAGAVVKRFFAHGVKIETGPSAGTYYYTRDHLGSLRELVDTSGAVRARFNYEPFGARTQVAGNLDADFGFGGHFFHAPSVLCLTRFRVYDSRQGQWLSRDPLQNAEQHLGPNLYAYVGNDPVNLMDPLGTAPYSVSWHQYLVSLWNLGHGRGLGGGGGGTGSGGHGGSGQFVVSVTETFNSPASGGHGGGGSSGGGTIPPPTWVDPPPSLPPPNYLQNPPDNSLPGGGSGGGFLDGPCKIR